MTRQAELSAKVDNAIAKLGELENAIIGSGDTISAEVEASLNATKQAIEAIKGEEEEEEENGDDDDDDKAEASDEADVPEPEAGEVPEEVTSPIKE